MDPMNGSNIYDNMPVAVNDVDLARCHSSLYWKGEVDGPSKIL